MKSVLVSHASLMARVNRALAKGMKLRKSHSANEKKTLGNYYTILGGVVKEHGLDLEEFAREKGVLAAFEKLDTKS